MSEAKRRKNIGELSPLWKGDNVSYERLHHRLYRLFPKSEHPICMLCKINPSQELACITGIYNMELRNWAWFCRLCHKRWDNVFERAMIKRKITLENKRAMAEAEELLIEIESL
jgi:hypothetical protein